MATFLQYFLVLFFTLWTLNNPCYNYKLNNNTIKVKDCKKNLGVTISINLKSSKQVALAVKKAETALGLLKRTVVCRDKNVFLKMYKLLVRPHLEYATAAWNQHFKRDVQLIEKFQKRIRKNIQGMKDLTCDERLIALNLCSLKKRRHIFDLTDIFKLMNNLSISDYSKFFTLSDVKYTREHNFKLKTNFGRVDCPKYCFSQRRIQDWNNLPWNVVNSTSVSQFKRLVSEYC